MEKVMMKLSGMTCPSCLSKIEKAVGSLDGTDQIKVLFNAGKLKLRWILIRLKLLTSRQLLKKWVMKYKKLRKRSLTDECRRKIPGGIEAKRP